MACTTHGAAVLCQHTSVVRIICRVSPVGCVIENSFLKRSATFQINKSTMSSAVHPQSQVDFLHGAPHRKHPGVTNMKTLRLPEQLQRAAQSVVLSAQIKGLSDRAQSLTQFLWSRKRPVDDLTLRQRATSLEKMVLQRAKERGEDIDDDHVKMKVLSELKKTTYHWTPLRFNEELGVVYMAARLAGGYTAVRRALNEILIRDPSFAPYSLLDFGSGLGTAVWASHSCWGDTLKEMVCVESSGPMNVLAERLLKGTVKKTLSPASASVNSWFSFENIFVWRSTDDNQNAQPHIKQVYFRQFLPVSPKVQFDLVVGAFSLSELASKKDRVETLLTLWRKTSSYLVLVENGTKEGHQILMEARDTLLKTQEQKALDSRTASVFAPCPHEMMCPKLARLPTVPCNFNQHYHPLPLPGSPVRQTETFSYVILSRLDRKEAGAGQDWARLVAPVLRRPRHVHCHTCHPDGQLHHEVVTRKKHGRDVYRCARSSDWGDQLPIIQQEAADPE
ncbi:Methyltransferase-like protein 17, mitochondrial [Merluccius polli]|uniref:Methyltransferase-like protein 17, mitochondrial n=1 Tax=Merluccius polli TaxID=89951 RepID=A0AA47MRF7_MERPO|nr:Methyltransferase-like protein 17, mitochondrial [Merluccius polli]